MTERKTVAENGIPIYSLTNEHSHSFFISLFLKSGSMYEGGGERGITHFLEHAVIRNINKLMDGGLYPALDRHGMEFNASTYSEMVQFYISGSTACFRHAADIISLVLSPIVLGREDVDAERSRIKAEIREADDRTSLASFTSSEVWRGTSLEHSITGTLGSVSRITARRLEEYRRRVFTSDNLFVYVTGNADNDNLSYLKEVIGRKDVYSGEKHENIAPVPDRFGMRDGAVRLKNADFTKIRYTYDIDMSRVSSPEIDLLYDIVLGGYASDVFIELSEKRGLFYDLGGSVERYSNIATFTFSYEVRENRLYEAAALMRELLDGYCRDILPEDRCMRAGYVDNAYMLYDDTRELNFTFAYDNHILGLGYSGIEQRRSRYAEVSAERLREVARTVFNRSGLTVTLKGKKKSVDLDRLSEIIFKDKA